VCGPSTCLDLFVPNGGGPGADTRERLSYREYFFLSYMVGHPIRLEYLTEQKKQCVLEGTTHKQGHPEETLHSSLLVSRRGMLHCRRLLLWPSTLGPLLWERSWDG